MIDVGLLENRGDRFTEDVAQRLNEKGLKVEYMKFAHVEMPIQCDYRIVIDRLSFQDEFLRTIMKSLSLKGTYVINNPFSNLCDDKITEYTICRKMCIPYPRTIAMPKINDETEVVEMPDLDALNITFPVVLKPYRGYAWQDVFFINTLEELKSIYIKNCRKDLYILQDLIRYRTYYRVYAFRYSDPLFIRYLPNEKKYLLSDYSDIKDLYERIVSYTIRLHKALDYDFNSLEWAVDENEEPYLIDAFNETPDILPWEIPHEYYSKIIENFCLIVENIYGTDKRNLSPFDLPV